MSFVKKIQRLILNYYAKTLSKNNAYYYIIPLIANSYLSMKDFMQIDATTATDVIEKAIKNWD